MHQKKKKKMMDERALELDSKKMKDDRALELDYLSSRSHWPLHSPSPYSIPYFSI
jgi:hypothetical protein